MSNIIASIDWQVVIAYLCLSTYAACILIYDDINENSYIKRRQIIKYCLITFFVPGYNVIVTVFMTLGKSIGFMFDIYEKYQSKQPIETSQDIREEYVFGFLKYKGIQLSELDDYIESRKLISKMIDKIN